jgi:hypothetical protein
MSICYINAHGFTNDYNLIGVTHMNKTSTKLPILIVNDLLKVWYIVSEIVALLMNSKMTRIQQMRITFDHWIKSNIFQMKL